VLSSEHAVPMISGGKNNSMAGTDTFFTSIFSVVPQRYVLLGCIVLTLRKEGEIAYQPWCTKVRLEIVLDLINKRNLMAGRPHIYNLYVQFLLFIYMFKVI